MKRNLNPETDCTARTRAWSRREFLHRGGMAALALMHADATAASAVTNGFLSSFFAFDREIQKFMQARQLLWRQMFCLHQAHDKTFR